MPANNQSAWDTNKPARLKGFERKDDKVEAAREPAPPEASAPEPANRARLNFPSRTPVLGGDPTKEPVKEEGDKAAVSQVAPRPPAPAAAAPEGPRNTPAARINISSAAAWHAPAMAAGSQPRKSGNRAYTPDQNPERVNRRQCWKYDLYVRSGRKRADDEANSYAGGAPSQ